MPLISPLAVCPEEVLVGFMKTAVSSSDYEKQLPWILLFGLIWGLFEMVAGGRIKTWQPALFGILMPFGVTILILVAKYFCPVPGAILLAGGIAATLKLFFSGMVLHGAFMAILVEAFLAEMSFLLFGYGFGAFLLAGILLQFYSAFHPLISRGVFCQSSHFVFFRRWLEHYILGTSPAVLADKTVSAVLLATHAAAGVLAALLGYWGVWVAGKSGT